MQPFQSSTKTFPNRNKVKPRLPPESCPRVVPGDDFIAITHVDSFSLGPPSQVFDLAPPRTRGPWGYPAIPRASRQLRCRATQGMDAPSVVAVCHAFPSENRAKSSLLSHRPRSGVSGALWSPPGASPVVSAPRRFAPWEGGALSSPWLHFACAKYD
jgi:hypothetical protein